jgi:hypothetical protein
MTVETCTSKSTAIVVMSALLLGLWMVPPAAEAATGAPSLTEGCPAGLAPASAFTDVAPTQVHGAAILCLHHLGILRGGSDGTFRPAAATTRGHVAIALFALLERSGHAPAATNAHPFTDLHANHAARPAIAALANVGVIQGTTATTFAPDRPIDRAQMASLIVRAHDQAFGLSMPQGPAFADTAGTTHDANIRRVVGAGITLGHPDGTFRPGESLSRAQMATFVARYLDLLISAGTASAPAPDGLTTRRVSDPARTIVEDAQGVWVATFTDGARTVALAGPTRRFDEASAANGVTSRTWVRVLPRPFNGQLDRAWLTSARADTSPDVLATSMQYLTGAPTIRDAQGVLLAADASYGPLRDGTRPVGSDWHDFQGVQGTPETTTRGPVADRYQSLDCSGYTRMLWGIRFGVPLTGSPDGGVSLPRRATQQALSGPGIVPIRDRGVQVTAFARLQPGDLVFFDATPSNEIDHVGVYLGPDDAGRHRFISSRRSSDGPTMGDLRGASLLDGDGLYARSFRATRRL